MTAFHTSQKYKHSSGYRELIVVLTITLSIMALEIIGGILSNSLALISDAGHMLVDALGLGIALFALNVAKKPATARKTYGYHRIEIMAALANGTTLILVAAYIFYEAYQRFLFPPAVRAPLMLLIAVIGLVANCIGIWLLRRASHRSLNIKAAFWHMLGDTISSVGVILAGIIIAITGWSYADPLIAILIGIVILWGATRIASESIDILLEGVPKHIKVDEVAASIQQVMGVEDVHDLHIWTITSGIYAMSAHVRIDDQMVSKSTEVIQLINEKLEHEFSLNHTTLQLECKSCPNGLVCKLEQSK